jgi:hypothetical protein
LEGAGGFLGVTGTFHAPGNIAIVATDEGETQIQVKFRGYSVKSQDGTTIRDHQPNSTEVFKLQQYDVLQLTTINLGQSQCGSSVDTRFKSMCMYSESDLTGSIIKGDKPFAVYGGSDCTFVPYDKFACDHIEEQLFPFSKWGITYIGSHSFLDAFNTDNGGGANDQAADLYRIVAGVDGTELSFTPPLNGTISTMTLSAGQVYQFQTTQDFQASSQDAAHPILMAQFFAGQEASNMDPLGLKKGVGDPSMVLMIPIQQYRNDYIFLTPSTIKQDYMNVIKVVGSDAALDGANIAGPFDPVTGTSYEVGRIKIGDGQHTLQCVQPCGLIVYGFDEFVSYGYPGGLDLKSITSVTPSG